MKNVCVITGGGSGIGLETAKLLGKENNYIILCGRTLKKLENAVNELKQMGIDAEAFECDVASKESVHKLAIHAKELGTVVALIHAAGMSPHMGSADTIMKTNAMGTIYLNEEFFNIMKEGSCIINVASMAGYLLPNIIIPKKKYGLSITDKEKFFKKVMARVNVMPKKHHSDIAYGISKNFVIWYSAAQGNKFGARGIRILSVSPGSFETPMGDIERKEASTFIKYCAVKRFGYPEEIAELLAFLVNPKLGYLTGTDILMDGGCVSGKKMNFKK